VTEQKFHPPTPGETYTIGVDLAGSDADPTRIVRLPDGQEIYFKSNDAIAAAREIACAINLGSTYIATSAGTMVTLQKRDASLHRNSDE
jgi:hypothetical protein